MNFEPDTKYAVQMDKSDILSTYRSRFFIPKKKNGEDVIYFAGNSLGLQPKTVREYIEQELKDWETLAVVGHLHAKHPWLSYHEFLTEQTAKIVGAKPNEVVNMNALTVNLHLMLVSFYRPTPQRHKILIEAKAFPSDHYALQSQIRFHGFDPETSLVEMNSREGETVIRTEDIEEYLEREGDTIALVMFGGVNYYTGQAFEMERITKAAHKKGCVAGFDLAHAAGNLLMNLHDWDIDFAVWCTYKYLNGGPGAIAGCFVHEKHVKDNTIPKFLGWWGQDKTTRFLMEHKFKPIPTVESWQLSNPPILQFASLRASLDIFDEVGMKALREKSENLTGYMEFLIKEKNRGLLPPNARGRNDAVEIITPKDINQRGCQLSLRTKGEGKKLHQKLLDSGVVCDWREPNVIRVAPVPMYNTFSDVYNFVEILFG